ncbi:MAG TPA: pyridoxamine 5'-phosphate oxidase family protein [Polyangia bacterium]
MPLITPETAAFLAGPNSIMVASHDEHLVPAIARAWRITCHDGDRVTADLPTASSTEVLAQLARDGRIAIVAELSTTHRTLQIKGRTLAIAPTPDEQRPAVEAAAEAFFAVCEQLGLPRRLTDRAVRWPTTSIEVQIDQVFEQSPGPGAGEPWRGPANGGAA